MQALSIALGILSLTLGALPLFRIKSQAAVVILIPKLFATALSGYVALLGLLGAVLGAIHGSATAIVAGAVGAALAADYVRRVTARHDEFEKAFGLDWRAKILPESERRMRQRRWTIWWPKAPEPRWNRDIVFSTISPSGRQLLADVWQPPAGVKHSGLGIVYLHGGGWHILDKDVLTRRFFRYFAAQGHVVMDAAYRHCPEVDLVGMVGDAHRAIAWMKANAAQLGVDPGQVVLIGASAGGHIALLTAYAPDHPKLTPEDVAGADTSVSAVVAYYGVADLRALAEQSIARWLRPEKPGAAHRPRRQSALERAVTKALVGRTLTAEQTPPSPPFPQILRNLVGGQPEETPEMYDLASPIHHVGPTCPPTLLFHGGHDCIVPAGPTFLLRDALTGAGVPVVCVDFPRTEHSFDLFYPPLVGPAGQAALFDLERFLALVSQIDRPSAASAGRLP